MLSWIKHIATNCPNAILMVTSQLVNEIPSTLRRWAPEESEIPIANGSAADIETYIRTRVRDGDESERWKESQNASILDALEKKLMIEANEM